MHTRAVEQEQIPALLALGVGLIPYSPLNAGQLLSEACRGRRESNRPTCRPPRGDVR